ncbi:hypothetical protein AAV97_18310 [Acinetobacter sp. Ag2]|uniref:hypothetical protein n=1 Tax=Acinetobacter sp. Ag2 TaxID=1646532 RepID=UPI000629715E|nr:hypothetical protein [Acinetobacter sp. Ag2]KKW75739.1 hypothetical protein AAV97_18310 [Acinetobacter sp. Ag2]
MLVKINSNVFVLASDIVSVKKNTKTGSDSYGQWFAYVKHEHGVTGYLVPDSEASILVSDINRFLEK